MRAPRDSHMLEATVRSIEDLAASTDVNASEREAATELATALKAIHANTTELLAHKKQLEQVNNWFQIALDNMARGLSMFDAEQRLIVCNRVYREIYDLPEWLTRPGTPFSELVRFFCIRDTGRDGPDDIEAQRKWIAKHVGELARGESFSHTQHLSGGRTILVSNQPLPGGGWVDLQEDITERRRAEQRIAWLARHDTLTEMPNRFHFHEQLEKALHCLEPGQGLAVHWLDLDGFKHVNDTLGHPVGDALLKSVGRRLLQSVRSPDFVGRLGGDEFAVVQTGAIRDEQASSLAERLSRLLREPHYILGQMVHVGASIGIASAPNHGRTAAELLKNADLALYRAKSMGRGVHVVYQVGDGTQIEARHQLESDLKSALREGQLELHYQPIVNVTSGEVTSLEALMRWRHPIRGMISPGEFIPLAESTGLIVDMGAWALQQACKDATSWPESVRVNVNLSPVQFQGSSLVEATKDALAKSGLAADRLELEITENVLLVDNANTNEVLRDLRQLGARIALDDFGTAFASLSYLRSFPFDKIKIDRTFVRDLTERKDCLAIVHAVAGLARKLEIHTVAEGVETLSHLNLVSSAGCDEVQGFYFSAAVPASEVAQLLPLCRTKFAAVGLNTALLADASLPKAAPTLLNCTRAAESVSVCTRLVS